MHVASFAYIARALQGLPPRRRVLEIGALDINGSVRQLFMGASAYLGIDLVPGPGVDAVADAATFTPDFAPDTIVCCNVLEHTPNAAEIVTNAYQVLAPGGVFLMTCAAEPTAPHSAVDGAALRGGEFYRNANADDARQWFTDFYPVSIEVTGGDVRVQAWKKPTVVGASREGLWLAS